MAAIAKSYENKTLLVEAIVGPAIHFLATNNLLCTSSQDQPLLNRYFGYKLLSLTPKLGICIPIIQSKNQQLT